MNKLRKKLVAEINDALSAMLYDLVLLNGYPDFATWEPVYKFGQAITKHDPWRYHIHSFDLYEVIGRAVKRLNEPWEKDVSVRVSDKLSKQRFDALGAAIRDYLFSIPRAYDLLVELPSMPRWGSGQLQLTAAVSLIELEDEKQTALAELARIAAGHAPKYSGVYAKISGKGYGSSSTSSSAVVDAVSQLKQFFQFFRHTNLYRQAGPTLLRQLRGPRVKATLTDSENPAEVHEIALPERLQLFLSDLSIDESKLTWFDSSKGLFALGQPRAAQTQAEKVSVLQSETAWIAKIIDCSPDWPDAERIRSALEWGFDSRQNDNETLALIQSCIGLEALLGDDDQKEPLTIRLADRCAYLLGKGHKDRSGIRKKFLEIYDVRSKLVHGRTPRLSMSDAAHLHSAQTMLIDAIWHEKNNLLKALDAESERRKRSKPDAQPRQ